ncbi:tropomyosin alpha-1 chain-like [Quercus lobata]|uniref:tropomyosin alpha-1 chain-like n=1 Tax=Quercus lobata TaxID=97700 RepID=UPI00124423C3|nr:tropomyosin alpha-1 chain-like [Quercus lobata]
MGETGLFAISQAMVMMKGLMGRYLSHETTLERVQAKSKQTEDELNQLRSWKPKMEKKLELSKKARKSPEQSTEEAKKALEGKNKEIQDLNDEIKKAYPDLDVSNIKVEDQAQTSVIPVASEDTDDLFADDEVLGDEESVQAQNAQVQPVVEVAHQSVANEAPYLENVVGQTIDTQVQQLP